MEFAVPLLDEYLQIVIENPSLLIFVTTLRMIGN